MIRDLRQLARAWRRTPVTIAALVLTIAFTVAVGTAVFAVWHAVVLQPVAFSDADRLLLLARMSSRSERPTPTTTHREYQRWRAQLTQFDDLASFYRADYRFGAGDEARHVTAHVVSANYFSVLGVRPVLGRLFQQGDDQVGGPRIALLAEDAWRQIYGGDPGVIGRRITLLGRRESAAAFEIVGVVPSAARLHWLPEATFFLPDRVGAGYWDPGAVREVIGRVKLGVSSAQATTELTGVVRDGSASDPAVQGYLVTLHEAEFGRAARGLRVLAVAVALVLVMAIANAAGLWLVIASARGRNVAIRTAMGASAAHLRRLVFTEHAVLTAIGAIGGLLIAHAATRLIVWLSPPDMPRIEQVAIGAEAFVVAALIAGAIAICGVLVGAALQSAVHVASALKTMTGFHTRTGRRWRDALVCAQLAVVLALLIGSSLTLSSFARFLTLDLGFDPSNVVAAKVWVGSEYELSETRHVNLQRDVLNAVRVLAEVEEVALATKPLTALDIYGVTLPTGERVWPQNNNVTGDYFRLLRIPLLGGRVFNEGDDEGAMIVNQAFAEQYFPGQAVIGRRFQSTAAEDREIIGVVGDTWSSHPIIVTGSVRERYSALLTSTASPATYTYAMTPRWRSSTFWLLLRSPASVGVLAGRIRAAVQAIDPGLAPEITTVDEQLSTIRAPLRFYTLALTGIAVVALLLVIVGVIAAAYQSVTERIREIAVRVAIGATPHRIKGLVMKRTVIMLIVSTATGLALGSISVRGLRAVLFDLEENNALVSIAATITVWGLVLAAAYWPARRASSVDPVAVLRTD